MPLVDDRTQYLSLEQIDRVCAETAARLLVDGDDLIGALRRELTAVSANRLRASALGQGNFGAYASRPGEVMIAGPGGVGKTYFAELLARVVYGDRFGDHLIVVNCRSYFAGRFTPLPRAKLEAGPLAIVALDGVEVLPEMPPVAALWSDAMRYGRAALPAVGEQGTITQQELSFAQCIIVANANVARDQAEHIGFQTGRGQMVGRDESTRLIRTALGTLFDGYLLDAFPADRWTVLPPLTPEGLRRLVDLRLAAVADLLPKGSPPVEMSDAAAGLLIERAVASRGPNKTAALVDQLTESVEPAINTALLAQGAPLPMRVRIDAAGPALRVDVTTK
jgi:ATP-dependent Clp protease ATP-binding subunit ClpA